MISKRTQWFIEMFNILWGFGKTRRIMDFSEWLKR